jgi:hypothetical protein
VVLVDLISFGDDSGNNSGGDSEDYEACSETITTVEEKQESFETS